MRLTNSTPEASRVENTKMLGDQISNESDAAYSSERPVLEVRGLTKSYETPTGRTPAIDDVSITLADKEFMTVVGPSGCGKTTLLKCVSGLLIPDRGKIEVLGRPIHGPPPDVALVFQDYSRSLFPWLTVAGNVGLPLKAKALAADERRELILDALEEVGLSGTEAKYPWQLSGGMQQRVAIARGIAFQPRVLLMDEPFASVDAQTRAELEDLILRVRADLGMTVLFVTHDIDEATYLGDRIVVLGKAPMVVRETIETQLPHPRDQVATKRLARFTDVRSHVFELIRGASSVVEEQEQNATGSDR